MAAADRRPKAVPANAGGGPRYPPNIKIRLTFLAFGMLIVAVVWLGLWIWVPAHWWNLLLCVLFALVGGALLVETRRPG